MAQLAEHLERDNVPYPCMNVPLGIFTTAFPFEEAADWTFVQPELPHLSRQFKCITIYPWYRRGRLMPLPKGVKVDESFIQLRRQRLLYPCNWPGVFMSDGSPAPLLANWPRRVQGGLTTRTVARWARQHFSERQGPMLLYTCSLSPVTLGLCQGLKERDDLRVVSRCVGGDVREDQHPSGTIPFKKAMLQEVDWLYPVSEHLCSFLVKQNPEVSTKITVSRNGISAAGFQITASVDGVWRILSCGMMVPVKRYDLLAKGLSILARRLPAQRIEWRHMLMGAMDSAAEAVMADAPANLTGHFITGIRDVRADYRHRHFDLFVHVSRSEGFSLAVAEALSCGIPVLATDSGGVSDMVDGTVGRLISNDIDAPQLADILGKMLSSPRDLASKKEPAVARWQEVADADLNYAMFAQSLAGIAETSAQ